MYMMTVLGRRLVARAAARGSQHPLGAACALQTPPIVSQRLLFSSARKDDDDTHSDFQPQYHAAKSNDKDEVLKMIEKHVKTYPVMLYMKGTPSAPQCGFSMQVVRLLHAQGVSFDSVNVLDHPEIRDGVKEYSQWPTVPQLYVKGEFVGGCDIITDMSKSGELAELLAEFKKEANSIATLASDILDPVGQFETIMVREDVVDPVDDYMESLEVPPGDQRIPVAQERLERTSRQSTGRNTSCSLSVAVKNRRYRRLQQLLEDTSEDRYFSDDMMQQRSPALFHFYLGQYSGLDEKTRPVVAKTELMLSTFLIDTHQRSEMEARRVAEQATWGQFTALNETLEQHRMQELYEVEHVEEEEEEEEQEREQDKEYEDVVAVDAVDERREQLVEVMCIRFLTGKDEEYVNYAEIDEDEGLDDFVAMQRDAEDRYFTDGTDAS